MIKYTKVILFLLFCFTVNAQVGINTETPDAQLDITATSIEDPSNTDGLLIPRLESLPAVNPTDDQNSMLIYLTATSDGFQPGFLYWDASIPNWVPLAGNSSTGGNAWNLDGNTSTSSNFLGTTNLQPLNLRVNNNQIASFNTDGTFFIGLNASVGTGNAVALGNSSSATGNNSIALGNAAEAVNGQTVALGNASRASGNNSIAIGNNAVSSNGQNVAIGNSANASGNNSVAIGNGATAPNANTIILGNNLNIGIGTNNPQARLQVDGSLKYVDGNQSLGRVLTSDANGNATWQAPKATYGEIFSTVSRAEILSTSPIVFGNDSPTNGLNALEDTFIQTGAQTGVYKITYTISVRRDALSQEIEFFVTQGFGAANKIEGSSVYVDYNSAVSQTTATRSFYHNVTSPFQQFYVFPDISNDDVIILPGSSLSIELID